MSDPVDKILADHIRQRMDDYQTPYLLGAWEQFDQQRHASKRRLLGWFRYAVAACLLGGMLAVPLWLADGPLPAGTAIHTRPDAIHLAQSRSVKTSVEHTAEKADKRDDAASSRATPTTKPIAPASPLSRDLSNPFTSLPQNERPIDIDRLPIRSLLTTSTLLPTLTWPLANGQLSVPLAHADEPVVESKSDNAPNRRRSVMWSIGLAPQSVYSGQSASSMALGGGVVSEIAINRRLSLSTGLSLGGQTLSISPPTNRPTPMSGRQLTATDVKLLAFDLPVNLNYRFGKLTKPLFHLSTGLSSLAFVRENYADTYQTQQMVVTFVGGPNGQPQQVWQSVTTTETENTSAGAFSGIYWGRLLNVAVGVERPLSQRLLFTVEPYLKYPLGSSSQKNLRLGSAGVSLRVGFR